MSTLQLPGIRSLIWVPRDSEIALPAEQFVQGGRAPHRGGGLLREMQWALMEVQPLHSWVRRQRPVVLHAHSRAAFLATLFLHCSTGMPLIMHMHFLARNPGLYRLARRMKGVHFIYNSHKTCRHYGDDPGSASIIVPSIDWPGPPQQRRAGGPRVLAAGAFVRSKNFHILIEGFKRYPGRPQLKLEIFGLSKCPLDPEYQARIVGMCRNDSQITLHPWQSDWLADLSEGDVFVHLGDPESFGIVMLEAFAKGCPLIVLSDTFLEDFPEPIRSTGIRRLERLNVDELVRLMEASIKEPNPTGALWESRRAISRLFLPEENAGVLAALYHKMVFTGGIRGTI